MAVKKADKSKLTVAERAYLKFLERGGEHGHDMEDWLAAEREMNAPKPKKVQTPARKKTAVKPRTKNSK